MLTAIKATYEDGQILWDEVPPLRRGKVVVTFLEETASNQPDEPKTGEGIRFGSLKGKITIADDFNEPLDDLHEYM